MNHRIPPAIPPASPAYRRNGSSTDRPSGSYFAAAGLRGTPNDSSGYLDGDLSGYHSTRTDDDHHASMLYYKDKPLQHKSLLAAVIYKIKKDPWKAIGGAALLMTLLWGYRGRAQTSRLLKELNVKTVDQAITKWKHGGGRHAAGSSSSNKETRELFAAQAKWVKRDTAWRNHVEKLQNHTQKESRRAVLDKFGPGPHHVQVKIVLPDHVQPNRTEYTPDDVDVFEIELAPLKDMPHSVHLFLEQVSHGLWDKPDLSFHVNTEHILMGGPTSKPARDVFQSYGLAHLAFPEYSASFPHEKYTLGFAGRPGGPSFYINSSNNTKVHGPGGQTQHALNEFADACFAKVVSGFNVLEEIIDETDPKHKTMIVGMKIIEWTEQYTQKDDEHWHKSIKDSDIDLKDDDYTDDMYYDSLSEAGFADDDSLLDLHNKKKLDETEKATTSESSEHVVQHHHHSDQYLEDEELLAETPPLPIEPPPEVRAQLDEIRRKVAEKRAAAASQ